MLNASTSHHTWTGGLLGLDLHDMGRLSAIRGQQGLTGTKPLEGRGCPALMLGRCMTTPSDGPAGACNS